MPQIILRSQWRLVLVDKYFSCFSFLNPTTVILSTAVKDFGIVMRGHFNCVFFFIVHPHPHPRRRQRRRRLFPFWTGMSL